MKDTFFRTMTWLHTWVGLLVCWLLLLVFFAGTLSYYRHEMNLWVKPELHSGTLQNYQASELEKQISTGQNYLNAHAQGARDWRINLPTERKPYLSFGWQSQPAKGERRGQFVEHISKTNSSEMITDVRESKGGHFFYRLHFNLHYLPTIAGRWVIGSCSMFMLLALISGIVIHKRIFKDLFSFRRNKGSRSWLDGHNVSSVIALPYHLMITYTGLMTLMFIYMPWGVETNYDGDNRAFRSDLNPARIQTKASGTKAKLIDATSLLPKVKSYWGEAPIKQVVISNPYDANSRISFYRHNKQDLTDKRTQMVFSGATGELVVMTPLEKTATHATYDTMISLHTARFAEPILRALFFFCGLLGCAMITTGALLWAIKIRQSQQKQLAKGLKESLGLRLVEGLNLTFIAGLPLATAIFFYANRLIPAGANNRSDWEVHSFFITLVVVAAIAWKNRSLASWRVVLGLGAISFLGLPILNALTSGVSLFDNIIDQQWGLVGFDSLCIVTGVTLLFAISRTVLFERKKQRPSTARKNAKPTRDKQVVALNATKGA
ncbi:PepSY domain-containing protein [Shewanella sp. UCD-KL12]|uniref:PepSY-associated TM helix domain-containing protein n=1 Tax=Shewanella sp. UCD-KL12 TaxID=1917163 RepID=UPI0009708CB3|nr:PepSY-associated TM helix domain-containing protein [Shewanella sp. UCD-KL12]